MDIIQHVQKASERLLRSDIFKPFGLALLKYDVLVVSSLPKRAYAATDYNKIYINSECSLFTETSVGILDIVTVLLLHEVSHIIFMHDKRVGSRDKEVWNYAADFMINLLLWNIEKEAKGWEKARSLVALNIDGFKEHMLFDLKYENMLEEEIYDELMKNAKSCTTTTTMSMKDFLKGCSGNDPGDGDSDGDGDNDDGNGNNGDNDDGDGGGEIKINTTTLEFDGHTTTNVTIEFPQPIEGSSTDGSKGGAPDDMDTEMIRTMFETGLLSRGFKNQSFKKFLTKMFDVKIPWKDILADSILIEVQRSPDVSYSRPRLSWLVNYNLPYMPNYEVEDVLGTLIVIIDESGSITDDNIREAVGVVKQADSYYKDVYVIKHDVSVQWTKFYPEKLDDSDIDDLLTRHHCGGTSHQLAFEEVMRFSQMPDNSVSLVLCVTDLYSDIEVAQKTLSNDIPRIYLKNDHSEYNTSDIMGKVIQIT
jgi:predicted metal-dependent peptidase